MPKKRFSDTDRQNGIQILNLHPKKLLFKKYLFFKANILEKFLFLHPYIFLNPHAMLLNAYTKEFTLMNLVTFSFPRSRIRMKFYFVYSLIRL